jgi:hypothetical protein
MTYNQCPHCKKYLGTEGIEEERLNALYRTNTNVQWAKNQLRILAEMAEDHDLPSWYVAEVRRIFDGLPSVGETPAPVEQPVPSLVAALLNAGATAIDVRTEGMAFVKDGMDKDGRIGQKWIGPGPATILVVPGEQRGWSC